ncbi:hypothetical protein OROHE_006325 [Orobanche hederae]
MNMEGMDNNGVDLYYTLDEALDMVGFGKFQALVLSYAGLGAMAEAMEVMILSFIGSSVKSEWGLSSGQQSLITTVVFAGMLIGAYLWGFISDNYGRRQAPFEFLFSSCVNGFYSSMCRVYDDNTNNSALNRAWNLLRSICGKDVYLEICISTTYVILGKGYCNRPSQVLPNVIVSRIGLLSVAVVTSIFAFLSALSPNYVSLVIFRMVAGIGLGGGPVYSSWYLEFVPVQNRGFWMVIFSTFWTIGSILEALLAWIIIPRLGWRWLLALSSVPCLLAFAFYFLTVESPRYLHLKGKITDAHIILKKIAVVNKSEFPSGTLVSHQPSSEHEDGNSTSENGQLHLAEIPGLILSAVLVDKFGRRISMALMYLFGFIFLLPLIFHQHELITTLLLFGARMCIIGTYTVAGIYCPELYPTSVRTTGVGVATAVGRVAGMICPVVAVGLVSGCHQMAAISLFEVVIILAGISVVLLPVETKGRNLIDIVAVNR